MAFQKRRLEEHPRKSYKKKNYQKRNKMSQDSGSKGRFWKIIKWFMIFLLTLFVLGTLIIYKKYIVDLPAIDELEKQKIAEASIIYDRNGNELYKIFKENRTYKNYADINKNMINAIVAGEDKGYWDNPWIDFLGIIRAVWNKVIGKSSKIEGTSTLTQQLIRNMVITNERTAERKIKEMYLAYKLTNNLSKEKIIELYLNKIEFWSNAFGIEQASKTFFGKKASDLNALESSILASLPKWPTYYSPYSNYGRLMGYSYLYTDHDEDNQVKLLTPASIEENKAQVQKLKDFITGFKLQRYSDSKALICGLKKEMVKKYISVDWDGCSVIDYSDLLVLLNGIQIKWENTTLEYQTGRKDYILGRMLEDKYIEFDTYKESLLSGIGFEFQSYKEDIKYPHFVFYVREFLEKKYGKEILEQGWLRIYTSLDPVLQKKAEEIIQRQSTANLSKFWAQNASLVSIDNKTWEVLAMVWGRDYFDEEHKGNINMATAQLQPGSTFKPFVYSIAIDQEKIGSKTPIYDLKTTFPWGYTPNNFDGKFMGKMNITTALNHSRNIPAVKMFFLAGGEDSIINWMEKLGIDHLRSYKENYFKKHGKKYTYGSSMALGTAMMSGLELARAYSVYANMWVLKEVIPVIKIYDSKWLTIEEFKPEENTGEKVMDPNTAYITNYILSDSSSRPTFWNKYLSLSGRKVAAKTGTSTKQYDKNGKKVIYPRNLWTLGYTPQVTTVVWSGNNDGSETKFNGSWLEASWPIWKEFMEFYHSDRPAYEWKKPNGVKEVNISQASWLLAPSGLDPSLVVRSLFVNAPTEYDNSQRAVEVDLMCNGPVTNSTPKSAIWKVNLVRMHSLKPDDSAWEWPVQAWVQAGGYKSVLWDVDSFITQINSKACERWDVNSNIQVWATINDGDTFFAGSNYVEIGYKSSAPMKSIDIYLDNTKIQSIDISGKTKWVYTGNMTIPLGTNGKKTLTFKAFDSQYYASETSYNISVYESDRIPPSITFQNPTDGTISLNKWQFFNLRAQVDDQSQIRTINIYLNEKSLFTWITERNIVEKIGTENLDPGKYVITVEAVDMSLNKTRESITLTVLWDSAWRSSGWRNILVQPDSN